MTALATPRVTVVGLGADGWEGLAPGARELVLDAEVLLGGPRQLALVPATDAVREPWPSPLLPALPRLLATYDGRRVVVLASGDPLLSGIATNLVALLGSEHVEVHPGISSVSLARARMGWSAESTDVVTLVGREHDAVRRCFGPGRRLVVLSSDGATPWAVAAMLVHDGYGDSTLSVLSDLGSRSEARTDATASTWRHVESPALNVVCVELVASPDALVLPPLPGLPDEAYEHDGQLTKRDLRALALSRLAPNPGELLWDVGAGAGSVGIEWMRTDPRCRAVAVESSPERAARIGRNATRLGVPGLEVRNGSAPEALAGLPGPDAVFVGGGATVPGVLDTCWDRLRPGGRLVAHAVTLETEAVLASWCKRAGGELTRVSVEQAEPLGSFTGWRPARPVVQWAVAR
ncbi:precorrin-6y C5,15-methyltransferase (decarboxylating) subunit CbiE [Nocardioides panacis]|uniref:Precorrin-6y C5,15-methyltransferase (Decarboxylating) subunit CbiE n=1 Tax=Nocardioides panacis TaxID=2849501 RepID=A0A975SVF2_9ACTN|nr:precorrin-6y C5,15-methyltransferase (decarboxylating) subunit CbiE [Nocardioides panacis]QWZ06541.1 precorrin-6y C5,15-methyltransferase (decarboxylating) subunit CbiE [Nocardioides panacis]